MKVRAFSSLDGEVKGSDSIADDSRNLARNRENTKFRET